MSPHHLATFLWLRWRLLVNQFTRGGRANQIALILAGVLIGPSIIFAMVASFPIGAGLLSQASPLVMMLVWDGIVFVFLMFWMIGLLTELQRSESLSLEKFLHLPVSLWGVFALNYLSSLFSLTLMILGPTMLGLILGLTWALGPAMLTLLPLAAAFVFMVTTVTYQFQGWLATLMQDKRRRRTVIVVVTLLFVLVFQLPNVIIMQHPWEPSAEDTKIYQAELAELEGKRMAKEIDPAEYTRRHAEIERRQAERVRDKLTHTWDMVQRVAWPLNAILPICWLPLGAYGIMEGDPLPAILGIAGMTLVGGASFWRAYVTTLRFYTGGFTGGAKPAPIEPVATGPLTRSAGMLAWKLPWISEQSAGIALACLRSLTRAPEAKMLLLTPLIMAFVFGGVFIRGQVEMPTLARPLLGFAAISMVMFTLVQFVGNQFGFDRGGFRIFVLSPTPRSEILLGKNLAVMPIAFALTLLLLAFVEFFQPLRWDHLLAVLSQFVSMYLLYCMAANLLSIFAPLAIAAGTMKPTSVRLLPIFLHMAFVFVMPFVLAPALLPLAVEAIVVHETGVEYWMINLPLSLVECGGILLLYRVVLRGEGRLLEMWEQRILELVTSKAE